MQLTIQQFSQVLEALKAPVCSANGTEKRRFNRIVVQARIDACEPRGEEIGPCFSVLTRDLSYGGMGLILGHGLAHEDRLVVILPSDKGPLYIASEVVFRKELAEGVVGLGIEFSDEIDVERFQRMRDRYEYCQREQQRIASSILG